MTLSGHCRADCPGGEIVMRELTRAKAERDELSARLQAVRDAVSEIRGERDRCKISADGWFGDGADPAKDYAVGALDGLDKALGWLERALDASLGTPGDEKPGSCCEGGCKRDTFGGALLCSACANLQALCTQCNVRKGHKVECHAG